jgi:hypothetical protein
MAMCLLLSMGHQERKTQAIHLRDYTDSQALTMGMMRPSLTRIIADIRVDPLQFPGEPQICHKKSCSWRVQLLNPQVEARSRLQVLHCLDISISISRFPSPNLHPSSLITLKLSQGRRLNLSLTLHNIVLLQHMGIPLHFLVLSHITQQIIRIRSPHLYHLDSLPFQDTVITIPHTRRPRRLRRHRLTGLRSSNMVHPKFPHD